MIHLLLPFGRRGGEGEALFGHHARGPWHRHGHVAQPSGHLGQHSLAGVVVVCYLACRHVAAGAVAATVVGGGQLLGVPWVLRVPGGACLPRARNESHIRLIVAASVPPAGREGSESGKTCLPAASRQVPLPLSAVPPAGRGGPGCLSRMPPAPTLMSGISSPCRPTSSLTSGSSCG